MQIYRISQFNLAVAALALVVALSSSAQAVQRPNIVFILADDHACQAISAYGRGLNQTPHIDRIAAEGARFDRCYVTNSLCGPSRAVILTGKYSHKNGMCTNSGQFDGAQQTFPKILQRAGYQTALFGKWLLVSEPTGFDRWEVLPGEGSYYSPAFITPEGRISEPGYVADVITDKALQWLRENRAADEPFLLMIQHKSPHRPWQAGPGHVADFKDAPIAEPATLFDDYANRADAARMAQLRIANLELESDLKAFDPQSASANELFSRMAPQEQQAWLAAYQDENNALAASKLEGQELVRWKYQRYVKDYLRTVQSIDDNVGRVLNYLDEAGLADKTIVIYASDQGVFLGEHGWYDKRFMYEPSLRAPLAVRWPGVSAKGAVVDHIVSNIDFAETLLDAAGVSAPADMQGRSLRPLLAGQPPEDWRKSFYYHYYEGPPEAHAVAVHYGVTDGRYKLIHYYQLDQWELFDLTSDPQELQSVYGHPDYAGPRQRLQDELSRLRSELEVADNDPPQASSPPTTRLKARPRRILGRRVRRSAT
ncbi:MAG: sulfatase [Pirellulales bacterium]|nr:sulfatase [Pirellulales bacterium]